MSFKHARLWLLLLTCPVFVHAQLLVGQVVSGPQPQGATLNGFATDEDDAAVPGATITVDGPPPGEHRVVQADSTGYFLVLGLHSATAYHLTASAPGFKTYSSPDFTLTPGQVLTLEGVKMPVGEVGTTITVLPVDVLAEQEVHEEIQQKVLGIIPNFYVVYQHDNVVALPAKLKFELAYKSTINPVNFAAAIFIGSINQAAFTPAYVEGAKGYGQRIGSSYLLGTTDVFLGGAVFPALFHQDPRYFYQGTGTKKSRLLHAVLSPVLCHGDNGKTQVNYSSILGDLSASALATTYLPPPDNRTSDVFSNAAITTAGRIANAILQEFVLSRLTTRGKTTP